MTTTSRVPTARSPQHAALRGAIRQTSPVQRPLALAVLAACLCGSFFLAWRSSLVTRVQHGDYATSLSGHSYHPKLCGGSVGDASPGDDSSSSGCSELHDPQLAQEVVQLPRAGLQLLSGDPQLQGLLQLLQAAGDQQWPLPLARRVTSVLLQGAVPPVQSSSSTETPQQQQQQAASAVSLSAAESGHAAGWRFITQALATFRQRSAGQLVPCSFDPSLPTAFRTRFLYAAAWPAATSSSGGGGDGGSSSTGTGVANTVLQLLNTVALLPPGYAYISVSVPRNATADSLAWLDLLQLLAAPLGVPLQVMQVGDTAAAAAVAVPASAPGQQPQQQHTGMTASQALDAALAGFFPAGAPAAGAGSDTTSTAAAAVSSANRQGAEPQQASGQQAHNGRRKLHTAPPRQLGGAPTPSSTTTSASPGGVVTHGSCPAGAPAPGCYRPEFVLLLEPLLYVCAADLVRLMEYPEDLVCGLQLDEAHPAQRRRSRRREARHRRHLLAPDAPTEATAPGPQQQTTPGAAAGAAGSAVREGPMAAAVAAAGQAVLQPEVPPEFEMNSLHAAYDASREISGEMLSAHAPYFTSHGPSQGLVLAGLPVPMYCCWGGAAKLAAGAFAAGLRFRGGEEGECHPPDALSLMCDDLWRTGRRRILLDPGVRTSSQLRAKSLFEHPRFPFFYYTHNLETTAWFDIHPLLPLQFWNKTAQPRRAAANNSSDADEDAAAAGGWTPADWEPGEMQMCCEGRAWSGGGWGMGGRPNHPTDCRRVKALEGKNHTRTFLMRCAGRRQGSDLGGDCGSE